MEDISCRDRGLIFMSSNQWHLTCVGGREGRKEGRAFCTSLSLWYKVIWFNSHFAPTWMFVFEYYMTHNVNMISYMINFDIGVTEKVNQFWGVFVKCGVSCLPPQFNKSVWSEGSLHRPHSAISVETRHYIYLLASLWTWRGRCGDVFIGNCSEKMVCWVLERGGA